MNEELDSGNLKKMVNPTRFKLFFKKQIDRRIADLGLSEGHLFFLIALDEDDGISLGELTNRVGVHKSLTTRMIKSLMENGFVEDREESGKEYSVVLTAKGRYAKDASVKAVKEVTDLMMGGLSQDDLRSFFDIIGKINRRMDEIEQEETCSADCA